MDIARVKRQFSTLDSAGLHVRAGEQFTLFSPELREQIDLARLYFHRMEAKQTASSQDCPSYGLKHRIEVYHGWRTGKRPYISNGACIVAAVLEGFPVYDDGTANPHIGITRRSLKRLPPRVR